MRYMRLKLSHLIAAAVLPGLIGLEIAGAVAIRPVFGRLILRRNVVSTYCKDPVDHRLATNRDSWYAESADATPGEWSEVHRPLILPVAHDKIDSAVSMLETKSAIPLSLQQTQTLLDVKSLDPDALLEEAAKDADAEAEKREKESQEPFFAGETAARFKELAAQHRQTAAKARALKGKVKPYLVRALYLNEGTGQFSASFKDSTLSVFHGSLGHHAVPMKRRPLVIFLEKAPTRVYVSVSMAE
jgi:hypothetical protein